MKLRVLALLVCLVWTGCARATTAGPQVSLPVRINNNLIPPASLEVFLVPAAGIEHNLGTIVGSGRHTLVYRGLPPSGEYQLVARADTRAMRSNVIVLDENVKAIDWDLQRNFVELTVEPR